MIFFLFSIFPVFGNLHSHTSLSYDAENGGSPDSAYLYAIEKGADFLAITEHNTRGFNMQKWNSLVQCADSFNKNGEFIAIAGLEVGKLNEFGHITIYQPPTFYSDSVYLDELYKYLLQHKIPACFAHPQLDSPPSSPRNDFDNFENAFNYNSAVSLIEVLNKENTFEKEVSVALDKGWHLGFIAVQDNHNKKWIDEENERGRIPLTGVWVEQKTREDLLASLKKRRTYGFELFPKYDTMKLQFSVNDSFIGSIIKTPSPYITLKIKGSAKVPFFKIIIYLNSFKYDSISLFSSEISLEKSYTLEEGSYYIWIKVIQSDFDRAWLSPVWVKILPHPEENKAFLYPNPVNPNEKIFIILPEKDRGRIRVYSSEGYILLNKFFDEKSIIIDADKELKGRLHPGIYILLIKGEKKEHFLKFAVE